MSTVTENDLRELKELINLRFGQMDSRFDRIENKVDNLTQDVNDVKIQLTKAQESINGLDTRVKNLEFANRGIFISVTAGILLTGLGALIKFLFFTNLSI